MDVLKRLSRGEFYVRAETVRKYGPPLLLVLAPTQAMAMGDNIAGRMLDDANTWLSDKWTAIFDPIYGWIFLLILGLFVLGLISWFAPFDWVKKINAVIALAAIAFVAGGWKGSRAYKTRYEQEREKRRQAEAAARQRRDDGGGDSGGGWNPFKW